MFGATVIHRHNIDFKESGLRSRSIPIHFRKQPGDYLLFDPGDLRNIQSKEELSGIIGKPSEFVLELKPYPLIKGIDGRTQDTYRPLLSLASLRKDNAFIGATENDLRARGEKLLRRAQADEPELLVLRSIEVALYRSPKEEGYGYELDKPEWGNRKIAHLRKLLEDTYSFRLTCNQILDLCEEMGFPISSSKGFDHVRLTPLAFLHACDDLGYSSETIEQIRSEATSPSKLAHDMMREKEEERDRDI
jgi:hypothetical protein